MQLSAERRERYKGGTSTDVSRRKKATSLFRRREGKLRGVFGYEIYKY
jgi:hypothetical protein